MIRRALLAAGISALAPLALPGAALATTQTAQLGAVKATLSFTQTGPAARTRLHLQIIDAGRVLYDEPVTQPGCSPFCSPQDPSAEGSSVRVLELEPDGSPDVILELYSGGAHCCSYVQVFSLDPGTMTYSEVSHDFGNPGAEIKQEAGLAGEADRWVFITTDNNFYEGFSDYAESAAPLQIYGFFDDKFALVTRNYTALIEKNAEALWRAFTHAQRSGTGLIAPWAADEDLLGNFQLVQARLAQELKMHHLNSPGPPWPSGEKFIDALNELLVKLGYQAGPG